MSRPSGPASPLSPYGVDTFAQRYGSLGTPTDSTFGPAGGPYGAPPPRAPQTSPPSSQHPSGGSSDMSARPSANSSIAGGRPPSSASSLGRSSDGRMGLGKGPPNRDSSRSFGGPANEDALQRHYGVLRQYLASSLRDEKGNLKPNRARDKLLRLSSTQFMELSTDVYDELMRREDDRLQRVRNVPRFLLPRQNFHPKRNQARQKLSTLPTDRFKQLATDVFFELERRIPRFAAGGERPLSNGSNSSRGAMRGLPPRGASRPGTNGSMDSYGRPLPKTLQQNTIVPNKGTMVEDDDDEEDDEDAFGLDGPSPMNADDKEKMIAQEAEINELKARLEALEGQVAETVELREKVEDLEAKLADHHADHHELQQQHEDVKHRNDLLQQDLDDKVSSHQQLQDDMQREVDQLRRTETQHDLELRELRAQAAMRDTQAGNSGDYEQRISQLQQQLAEQEKISTEVREQAMSYLQDMRELSKENDAAIEQEEKLAAQVVKMEKEIEQWRQRYAQVKAQNKSLRASTIGLGIQTQFDSHSLLRQEGILSSDGLVRDVDVTHYQMAIDELLKSARQPSSEPMLDGVKNVVVCVQSITSTIGTDGYPTPSPSPLSPNSAREPPASVGRLKARVTGTANSLITATKQHSSAAGLSPVVLLDAAASNLTAAVVELIKAVGIRPSAEGQAQEEHLGENHYRSESADMMESYYDDRNSEDLDRNEISIPVPQTNGTSEHITNGASEHMTHPEQGTSPFSLGGLMRSDTLKKTAPGGWFGGWGKKPSVDESGTHAGHDDFS